LEYGNLIGNNWELLYSIALEGQLTIGLCSIKKEDGDFHVGVEFSREPCEPELQNDPLVDNRLPVL
jgi:hypothetical protein